MVPTAGQATSFGDTLAATLSSPPGEVRSVLTLNDSGPSDPNRKASGNLTDANGTPLANTTLTIQYTPINGTYTQYQLSGTAPASAVQATVGFRVNADYPATWPGFWYAGDSNRRSKLEKSGSLPTKVGDGELTTQPAISHWSGGEL